MSWDNFIFFALPAVAMWLAAGVVVYRRNDRLTTIIMGVGIAVFAAFILGFWITLGRPPMRTMGETRLWYSFFLSGVGFAAWRRWKYPWLLSYSAVMATVFVLINLLKPRSTRRI